MWDDEHEDPYKGLSQAQRKFTYRHDILEDWLSRPSWNPTEAKILLAGGDPSGSQLPYMRGCWRLLNGTSSDIEPAEMHERIGLIDGLELKTGRPAKIVEAAQLAGIIIPWINTVDWRGNEFHDEIKLEGGPGTLDIVVKSLTENQAKTVAAQLGQSGGLARRIKFEAAHEFLSERLGEMKNDNFRGFIRAGKPWMKKIVDHLDGQMNEKVLPAGQKRLQRLAIQNHVSAWLKKYIAAGLAM